MNLLIVEYFSGGGYANMQLSSSILCEAYAMLRTLIADSKNAGHYVTTFLDFRLNKFNAPNQADQTVVISSRNELYAKLRELSSVVDGVYVIGPESDQILEKMVETVESSGGTSFNCESDDIKRVSNKMTLFETLKHVGIKTPETVLLGINEKPDDIKRLTSELGYPMVFKPLDGVGCGGLSVVKNHTEVAAATLKVAQESSSKQVIAQRLIKGKAASVCVFSTGTKALAVTLNKQLVTLASPDGESKYLGGVVPFDHMLMGKALQVAEKVVETIKGLKGYVGVDMILTEEEPIVIEVNPRLTVSYIGLQKTVNFNPAQTLIDAVTKRKLPTNNQKRGYCYFSKIAVPSHAQGTAESFKNKGVVVPPFPVEENKPVYVLVAATSNTVKGAQSMFYRTKKRLLKHYGSGE